MKPSSSQVSDEWIERLLLKWFTHVHLAVRSNHHTKDFKNWQRQKMSYLAFSNKKDGVKPLQCVVNRWAGVSSTLNTQRSVQCLLAKETWWINMLLPLQFASPVNGMIIRGISYNIKNLNLIFSALNSFSAISCPRLVSPSNGRFTSFPQTRYDSIVTVECNEGYFLIGQNVLRCVDNANDGIGEWNERIPTCRREILITFCCKNVKDFLRSFVVIWLETKRRRFYSKLEHSH